MSAMPEEKAGDLEHQSLMQPAGLTCQPPAMSKLPLSLNPAKSSRSGEKIAYERRAGLQSLSAVKLFSVIVRNFGRQFGSRYGMLVVKQKSRLGTGSARGGSVKWYLRATA